MCACTLTSSDSAAFTSAGAFAFSVRHVDPARDRVSGGPAVYGERPCFGCGGEATGVEPMGLAGVAWPPFTISGP